MKSINTQHLRLQIVSFGAPILIFLYGLLRLFDVIKGNIGHGFAWNLGHILFFVAILLLGGLAVDLRLLVPSKTKLAKVLAYLLMVGCLFGAACFLWGIIGDLFERLQKNVPVPGLLRIIGPVLFQVGLLGQLVMLTTAHPRQIPIWSPIIVLAGFLIFAINLNLLPVGALCLLIGLIPLTRKL